MTTSYPYGASVVTVTITGVSAPVNTYGGLVAAKDYLYASSAPGPTAFRALADDDSRSRTLVDASRYLDSLSWSDIDDADAAEAAVAIVHAAFELAGLMAADNETTSAVDSGSNVKSLAAKGVAIEFFRPTSALDGTASVLPPIVMRLIGRYLATADVSELLTGVSNGTDEDSYFDDCDHLNLTRPF